MATPKQTLLIHHGEAVVPSPYRELRMLLSNPRLKNHSKRIESSAHGTSQAKKWFHRHASSTHAIILTGDGLRRLEHAKVFLGAVCDYVIQGGRLIVVGDPMETSILPGLVFMLDRLNIPLSPVIVDECCDNVHLDNLSQRTFDVLGNPAPQAFVLPGSAVSFTNSDGCSSRVVSTMAGAGHFSYLPEQLVLLDVEPDMQELGRELFWACLGMRPPLLSTTDVNTPESASDSSNDNGFLEDGQDDHTLAQTVDNRTTPRPLRSSLGRLAPARPANREQPAQGQEQERIASHRTPSEHDSSAQVAACSQRKRRRVIEDSITPEVPHRQPSDNSAHSQLNDRAEQYTAGARRVDVGNVSLQALRELWLKGKEMGLYTGEWVGAADVTAESG